MKSIPNVSAAIIGGVCLAVGWYVGSVTTKPATADPTPIPKTTAGVVANPSDYRLWASLYVQTSAEYRACCLQTFRCAFDRLEKLAPTKTPKPAAVVVDLDETIIDNAAFQSLLHRHDKTFSEPIWDMYERDYPQEVRLVPGAKEFIEKTEALGLTIVYVSNRLVEFRESTIRALDRLKLNTKDISGRLFLKAKAGSSEKQKRRDQVAEQFTVIMLVGDNLRDFSEEFAFPKIDKDAPTDVRQKAIAVRADRVDSAIGHWGVDWFILPNPVYGEWERIVPIDAKSLLRPTEMTLPTKP